jgi:excinuclease ABC subunit C
MKAFPSLKKLRAAQQEDIEKVPGIGPSLAASIVEVVHTHGGGVNMTTGEILT